MAPVNKHKHITTDLLHNPVPASKVTAWSCKQYQEINENYKNKYKRRYGHCLVQIAPQTFISVGGSPDQYDDAQV